MGTPHPPEPALLFLSVLFVHDDAFSSALPQLSDRCGKVLTESAAYTWDHSHYYDKELGTPIRRKIIFYRDPFDPLRLPDIKIETNELEAASAGPGGGRRINLDPGYIMRSRVILASSKDYSHRIYLGKGIYGEVALYYQGKSYQPLPYTYYDYRQPEVLELFSSVRKELRKNERVSSVRSVPDYPDVSPRQNT